MKIIANEITIELEKDELDVLEKAYNILTNLNNTYIKAENSGASDIFVADKIHDIFNNLYGIVDTLGEKM